MWETTLTCCALTKLSPISLNWPGRPETVGWPGEVALIALARAAVRMRIIEFSILAMGRIRMKVKRNVLKLENWGNGVRRVKCKGPATRAWSGRGEYFGKGLLAGSAFYIIVNSAGAGKKVPTKAHERVSPYHRPWFPVLVLGRPK